MSLTYSSLLYILYLKREIFVGIVLHLGKKGRKRDGTKKGKKNIIVPYNSLLRLTESFSLVLLLISRKSEEKERQIILVLFLSDVRGKKC